MKKFLPFIIVFVLFTLGIYLFILYKNSKNQTKEIETPLNNNIENIINSSGTECLISSENSNGNLVSKNGNLKITEKIAEKTNIVVIKDNTYYSWDNMTKQGVKIEKSNLSNNEFYLKEVSKITKRINTIAEKCTKKDISEEEFTVPNDINFFVINNSLLEELK